MQDNFPHSNQGDIERIAREVLQVLPEKYSTEQLIQTLKDRELSKIATVHAMKTIFGIDRTSAIEFVHNSEAWRDAKLIDEADSAATESLLHEISDGRV